MVTADAFGWSGATKLIKFSNLSRGSPRDTTICKAFLNCSWDKLEPLVPPRSPFLSESVESIGGSVKGGGGGVGSDLGGKGGSEPWGWGTCGSLGEPKCSWSGSLGESRSWGLGKTWGGIWLFRFLGGIGICCCSCLIGGGGLGPKPISIYFFREIKRCKQIVEISALLLGLFWFCKSLKNSMGHRPTGAIF